MTWTFRYNRAVLFSTPLLRAINLSIAALLIAVVSAAYWYAWRPLAQTSGEISAPISAKATISRDALGVPHIQAASWEDAIFLQGFVTAQDRMWQMDALRRLAAGELAEVIGRTALEADQEAHQLRLARIAEESEQSMSPADRAVFAAYARGVNFYLETHRGRLPVEFALLNYDPRPWRIRDTILAGLQMYRTLTNSWRDEIQKLHMLQKGDRAKVEFLFPARAGGEVQPGSNAWAVSGAHTASGKPILANDPHLDFGIPSTWHMVHLQAPGLDVTGVSLPGVPAVIVGHNQRIAWGVTNLQFDVQDLYREQIDPQSGRYVFRGQVQQARLERTAIAVKGAKPIQFDQWITRHGPLIFRDANEQYSIRWTAAEPSGFQFPFLDVNRAGNWNEFTAALARFPGPGQNFVYADVDGNIGYHATGRLPIRPEKCGGDVPADGASGECEWQGFVPFEDLPQFYNPSPGLIVTANQNPFPADYRYPVAGNFAAYYRSREIRTLLERGSKWQAPDMLGVQKDVYSAFSDFLAKQLVAAADARKNDQAQIREAVDLLRSWNGQMEKGTPQPLIVTLAYDALRKSIADRAAPGLEDSYTFPTAPVVIERLLRERPADWFPDYDQLLLKCLGEAIENGVRFQGSKLSRWDYGQYNELRLTHPVDGQLPMVGRYFNIGPVPMSGSPTTIKQSTRRLGPSMRMIVDLADLDRSLQNITVGESGQPLSKHFRDQWGAYYGATSFPMQFRKVDAKQVLSVVPDSR
ncbi:MAG TPA: penicillin acylase family protein [Bryobacteraceae bacterium]|nr:penicillin acylase family protein [Bryobacteraceae bacterium]